jgi:peptidyl-prolyl cis-trans isomerase C
VKSLQFAVLFLPLGVVCAQTSAPVTPTKPKPAAAAPARTPATGTATGAKTSTAAKSSTAATKVAGTHANTASNALGGKVILTIDSETITDKQFEAFLQALPDNLRKQAESSPQAKRQMAEQLVRVKLLAQEAIKKGLDKDPVFQAKVQFQYENMLAGQVFSSMQSSATSDEAALHKAYEEHKAEGEEVTAKHILIRFKGSPVPVKEGKTELTEEESLAKAQELRKEILAGKDFATIAKAESDDTGSAIQGGDLGHFKRGQMVPAFEQTAFSLKPGEVSEPVKTQFGYHLIKVESHNTKTFEEMKPDLEARAKPEAARQFVEDLRKKSNVVLDDAYFGAEKQ